MPAKSRISIVRLVGDRMAAMCFLLASRKTCGAANRKLLLDLHREWSAIWKDDKPSNGRKRSGADAPVEGGA